MGSLPESVRLLRGRHPGCQWCGDWFAWRAMVAIATQTLGLQAGKGLFGRLYGLGDIGIGMCSRDKARFKC